jgi:hypothetical protein
MPNQSGGSHVIVPRFPWILHHLKQSLIADVEVMGTCLFLNTASKLFAVATLKFFPVQNLQSQMTLS